MRTQRVSTVYEYCVIYCIRKAKILPEGQESIERATFSLGAKDENIQCEFCQTQKPIVYLHFKTKDVKK